MSLQQEIDRWRNEIRTDNFVMSIGEWISLYNNDEIDIHPEFQRFYRWDSQQKSNLIESLLLGIPIPPIFVSQRQNGVWDVVDGLQRLSTLYEFFGILKDASNNLLPPLQLERTKYLPSMKGKYWENTDSSLALTQDQRLILKRSKLSVSIILRESDDVAKYELFQRLNTGGSNLTAQEVRNCILVMLNSEAYTWLRELSQFEPFQECISLSDKNLVEQYDMELTLRFIIFSNLNLDDYDRSSDVGEFITSRMIDLFQDHVIDRELTRAQFETTFNLLNASMSGNSFRRYTNGNYKGGFLLSPYEVVAYGLGSNFNSLPDIGEVEPIVQSVYSNPTYVQWSGSGVRANSRLPHLIPLGRQLFSKK